MIKIIASNCVWDFDGRYLADVRKIAFHTPKLAAEYARLLVRGGWEGRTRSRYNYPTTCNRASAFLRGREIAVFDGSSNRLQAYLTPDGKTVVGTDRLIVEAAVAAYNAACRMRRAKKAPSRDIPRERE